MNDWATSLVGSRSSKSSSESFRRDVSFSDYRTEGQQGEIYPENKAQGSRVLWGDQDLSPPSIRGSTRVGVGVGDHGMG